MELTIENGVREEGDSQVVALATADFKTSRGFGSQPEAEAKARPRAQGTSPAAAGRGERDD